jgi:uncharacterized damage-inducible protein DinB
MSDHDASLRRTLVELLRGGHAHLDFDKAIDGIPADRRGAQAPSLPHTLWQILEHLRMAQIDILDFSRDPNHVSPKWPEGYWPETAAPPDDAAWEESVAAFRRDLEAVAALVEDPATDLHARIPWGKGSTILDQALLVIDHNAYHLGQLVSLRQALGIWQPAALP